uniref:ATP synthase F0 subunit 8 n=1 Tax=Abia mengmeng TaxID=2798524 RepID=UPI002237B16F|nr:ATP synthase F0 subunit 8 [Abia mengmeng]UYK52121.1 ATP synthase F0 subunit 8 [Abia mengmeng]
MPQMFPMEWLNQYIYFLFLFYFIFIITYYSITNMNLITNKTKSYKKSNLMNWKW